jgi:hypothetical protein
MPERPDWDANSPELIANITAVLNMAHQAGIDREPPSLTQMQRWHARTMQGLQPPHPSLVSHFRNHPSVPNKFAACWIGDKPGVSIVALDIELHDFENTLADVVEGLDNRIPPTLDYIHTAQDIEDVVAVAAWAHSEWVRIHPFANGNGRTARLWANAIFMRYGLPAAIQMRPRLRGEYEEAAHHAMDGNWQPTYDLFYILLTDALNIYTNH